MKQVRKKVNAETAANPNPDRREQLRALLQDRARGEDARMRSEWIPIRASGSSTPLICVHGGGAGLASYQRLAPLVAADQPVFGMQMTGMTVDDPRLRSIEQLAEVHLATLRREIPGGPLMICGHSMAAVIAFEMAQRLRDESRDVRLLAVIDQPGPDIKITIRHWIYWQLIAVSHLPWRERMNYIAGGFGYRLRHDRRVPLAIRKWLIRRAGTRKSGQSSSQRNATGEYRRRMSEASMAALTSYEPRPYSGPMALFRAESSAPRLHADRFGGWGRITQEQIEVIEIPGHHMNIFQDDNNLVAFGERLEDCLQKHR